MNIETLLSDAGIGFRRGGEHHHVKQGWLGIDCPWCGTTGKYHLGISLRGWPNGNCWRCGPHRASEIFGKLGISLRGVDFDSGPRTARQTGDYRRPAGVMPGLAKQHRVYLRRRGFDPDELVRLWDLGSIGIAARLSWRIFVPVWFGGQQVSWTTRSISKDQRRYMSARPEEESVPIKETLYGWDYVRQAVVVCEGPTDVWRIGPGAVATYGLAYSRQQINLLASVPYRLIAFDDEPAGHKAALALAEQLGYNDGETYLARTEAADVGSAGKREVAQFRAFLDFGIDDVDFEATAIDRRAVGGD